MTEGRFRLIMIAWLATLLCLGVAVATTPGRNPGKASSAKIPPPSVLLITLDTVRADRLGCYGYSRIETPAIDQLAAEGVRFENAYAQVPITLPSHAVILTGTYPMFNGVRDFTSPGLPSDVPTLAEVLRRSGYHTAAFVSSFVLNTMWGLNRGFEVYDDNVGFDAGSGKSLFLLERRGDLTVDRMLDWLSGEDGKPFFVWLHLYDPHSPYRPPEPYRTRYLGHPYDGEIAFDDAQVGRVIARLKALNLYENTLVVLLSDHGESLGEHAEDEHGFFIYNATLRVPLIIKLPGKSKPGRAVTPPVGTVDIAPTIAQVCKVSETKTFQGRSLLRAIEETRVSETEAVYAESYYPRNSFGWHELRAVVTRRFKFIEAPRAELYELGRDPWERANLIATNSATAASLREKLGDFEKKFRGREQSSRPAPLDPETLEKLKSLGYVGYQAPHSTGAPEARLADPKDKIGTLNQILRAGDLMRVGKYAEADQLLARLEREDPDLYVIPFQKGENNLAWGNPQAALEEFRKSLSRNPTFDQAALGLGRAHFLLGQDREAATALELALHLNPRNFLARVALAKVYWRENLPEKAQLHLAEVVEKHPEFAEAHADFGIILAKLGKHRQAAEEIERGINQGYRDAIAYNYLGLAYAGLGESPKAIRAYEQAVALNPRYAAAYINLALEYRKKSQPEKAQSYYRKACELSDELCRQYAQQFTIPQSKAPK